MKKIILIFIIIIELFIIKIPKYVELNNLAIIEDIIVEYKNNQYTIQLKEIIPIKENQSISYKYKFYQETSSSITNAYKKLEKNTKKKLYLQKAKSLKTNIISSNKILSELNIKPKIIIHSNSILIKE